MLALSTGDQNWAELFRQTLLMEALEGSFTGPAHSVKYGQYEAGLRAYYYPRVRTAFPGLFAIQEAELVKEWFAQINQRALTVGWVDALYAVAFAKWPEGPYENQESGAGLLALLETNRLADPDLSDRNRDYLARNPRGWSERFRNTDDSLVYQLDWINNAYFQSLYSDSYSELNRELAFEWLLFQALPNGGRIGYNHVGQPSLAGVAYLGAQLLGDPRYIWLAGRSLDVLEARGEYLRAQPGVEMPMAVSGLPPAENSCLLYSQSGLPNQVGPLAPDKVVLRDGWDLDSSYLLVNLRFTGWHRYKATNTITLAYQGVPLIQEVTQGDRIGWLPEGRSLFRDKRIPRENLNGLLIRRSGLASVVGTLTGVGSPWHQDPPHYATVVDFNADDAVSSVHVRLADWHSWTHDRLVHLVHDGPTVVVDVATSTDSSIAEVSWHLRDVESVRDSRARLRGLDRPVEILWLPVGTQGEIRREESEDGRLSVTCPGAPGKLRWITVVLPNEWVGAHVAVDELGGALVVGDVAIPLGSGWLAAAP